MAKTKKKVLVAMFGDLFHSGHVEFLRQASLYGDVYVSVGNNLSSVYQKNKTQIFDENERLLLIKSCRYVKEAWITKRIDKLSFIEVLDRITPDIFITNEDGHSEEKQKIIESFGVQYIILKRTPPEKCSATSSSEIREKLKLNHVGRIAFGGFTDQLFLNKIYPGSIIVGSVITDKPIPPRSGMASSTLKQIQKLNSMGFYPTEKNLKQYIDLVFCLENPPYREDGILSGMIDAYGVVHPFISKMNFDNGIIPKSVDVISDEKILNWVENNLFLLETESRPSNSKSTMTDIIPNIDYLKDLKKYTDYIWDAIRAMSSDNLSIGIQVLFNIVHKMVPQYTSNNTYGQIIKLNKQGISAFLQGAGISGMLICYAKTIPENATRFKIKREI